MGLNISVYKILSKEMEQGWDGQMWPYYKTEAQNWFDFIRHSGDKQFVSENDFASLDEDNNYYRPKDFNKCREFVKSNVVEVNQSRLLKALDEMEKDESLVFSFSW